MRIIQFYIRLIPQFNVLFIWVLTELSTNSERNNKKSQAKKLSKPSWEGIVLLVSPFYRNLHSCFLMLSLTSLHTHTHTCIHIWHRKTLTHYKNFIHYLTNKMKCYSATWNTSGTETCFFLVYCIFSSSFKWVFSDYFICNLYCFYTTDIAFISFRKVK